MKEKISVIICVDRWRDNYKSNYSAYHSFSLTTGVVTANQQKHEMNFELDLKSQTYYYKNNLKYKKQGGVTVSTGISEAVVAYRGSYRPR